MILSKDHPLARVDRLTLRYRSSRFVTIPRRRFIELVDALEPDTLALWAAELFALMNLSWQYVDTVLDIASQMKIRETRPLTRRIRELRRNYDQFRCRAIDDCHVAKETETAEAFEEFMEGDFKKLFYALDFEVSRMDIVKSQRPLVIATYQAVTLLEAVRIYARRRDGYLRTERKIDVKDCCLIQEDFLKLYPLVPLYAGDCFVKDLPAVRMTANIIVNKMEQIRLPEDIYK